MIAMDTACIECGALQTHRVCGECFDNGPLPTSVLQSRCRDLEGKWTPWYRVASDFLGARNWFLDDPTPKQITIDYQDGSQMQYRMHPISE